ncbi:MAG: hypothetical protein HYR62_05185 [Actinobacteria bacterium]|nr:hypothetical protein [Actinomycetota bacterium]MBI3688435.1 hypothetical protein [Actinomycetota bacterium]
MRRRGDALQVRVHAGTDPLTGQRIDLTGSVPIPVGKDGLRAAQRDAEVIRTRLLAQVDQQRATSTKVPFGRALDAWLRVHEAAASTMRDYEMYVRLYVKPALGTTPISKVTTRDLEEFYADLRRCRARCTGRPYVVHRTDRPHVCEDEDRSTRKLCRPHECRPLSTSMVRQIHFTISSTMAAALRWEWITNNPAELAKKPRQTSPQPDPPSFEQAARIVGAAWEQDDDWGTFVWLAMVTGMRRGELLALHWHDVDLVAGMLEIRRNYVWVGGRGIEKDTKTHQMRRKGLIDSH